jgi:hypothetical protein
MRWFFTLLVLALVGAEVQAQCSGFSPRDRGRSFQFDLRFQRGAQRGYAPPRERSFYPPPYISEFSYPTCPGGYCFSRSRESFESYDVSFPRQDAYEPRRPYDQGEYGYGQPAFYPGSR